MLNRGLIVLFISLGVVFLVWSLMYQFPGGLDPKEKRDKKELTNSDMQKTLDQPSRYTGRQINIYGQVAKDPEYDSEGTHMQVYLVSGANDYYVVADYPARLEKDAGDFINIKGRVGDTFIGRTDDGLELKTIRVTAATIVPSTPEKVLAPAIKVQKTKMKRVAGYVSITIDRVEFADFETRFYVKLGNQGTGPAIIHLFNSYVNNDGDMMSLQPNQAAGYKEIPIDLPAGAQDEGVLVFPAMKPNTPIKLILGISGAGWERELKFDLIK